MTTMEVVLLVVVLLVVLGAVAAAVVVRNRKRAQLRSTFGSEYDRTVERTGGRRDAERELAERAERRRSLDIRPLPETDRLAYAERWRSTQADFVDRPGEAVRAADALVTEVMAKRGYPVDDVDQMARDVSVDHADTVEEYRSAQAISQLNDRHQASTEQLRQAMVHYRSLFDDLLTGPSGSGTASSGGTDRGRDDERVPADDVGDATDEDRRPDERAGREREVVHVERDPLPGGTSDGPDVGRTGATRVEGGGLAGREQQRREQQHRDDDGQHRDGDVSHRDEDLAHRGERQSGLGRGGSAPDSLVRGGVADGTGRPQDDRTRDERPPV